MVQSFFSVTLIFVAVLVHASPQNLDGTWQLVTRECSNGNIPNDRVDLDSEVYVLELEGEMGILAKQSAEGPTVIGVVTVDRNEQQMVRVDYPFIEPATVPSQFSINGSNELILLDSPFEAGGSCSEGSTLKTTFHRI